MIIYIKIFALYVFLVSLRYLYEHIMEWAHGQSTSAGLLPFLTLLLGAGATFVYKLKSHVVDKNHNGISDEDEKEANHENWIKPWP